MRAIGAVTALGTAATLADFQRACALVALKRSSTAQTPSQDTPTPARAAANERALHA